MSIGDELGREEELGREYFRLIWISQEKRSALEDLTRRNLSLKNFLTITAGILSLISAATLAAVIVEYVSSKTLTITAFILAFLGGILALIGSVKYNHRELFNLHIGASKFLELREHASGIACDRQLAYKTRKQRLSELWEEYTRLSAMYDHYVKVGEKPPTSPIYQIGHQIAAVQIGEEEVKEFHWKLYDEMWKYLRKSKT